MTRPPGWDSKEISRIAKNQYGSFEGLFIAHRWPERGADMMRKVQRRVVEAYGSALSRMRLGTT